jgi:hypothetical protein
MFGKGGAHTDFDIVRVGAEGEKIYWVHERSIRSEVSRIGPVQAPGGDYGELPRELERRVSPKQLPGQGAGQDAGGNERPGGGRIRSTKGEQMAREVTVRPDAHESIPRVGVRLVPAPGGSQTQNVRVGGQAFIHQLTGALVKDRLSLTFPR